MFSFYDKCMWIGSSKFPVVWSKHLASLDNDLAYGPETTDLTKGHVVQLYQ